MQQCERLIFPCCHINESVYQIIQLRNRGHTLAKFDIEDLTSPFSCKPTKGVLRPNQHQLIVVKFHPLQEGKYSAQLKCILNNSTINMFLMELVGYGETAKISLEDRGLLYFKGTCLGTKTQRLFHIKNTSGIPVDFTVWL